MSSPLKRKKMKHCRRCGPCRVRRNKKTGLKTCASCGAFRNRPDLNPQNPNPVPGAAWDCSDPDRARHHWRFA